MLVAMVVGMGAAMIVELTEGTTEEEATTIVEAIVDTRVGTTEEETTAEVEAALVALTRVVGVDPPDPAPQTATGPPGAV